MQVEYPIAVDNDYAIWNGFSNQYWPALYLIDAKSAVRFTHFGEGAYDESERGDSKGAWRGRRQRLQSVSS